jgi:hypothetical protein
MGRISILECMLSGARELLQLRPILSGSECYRPPRVHLGRAYPVAEAAGRGD